MDVVVKPRNATGNDEFRVPAWRTISISNTRCQHINKCPYFKKIYRNWKRYIKIITRFWLGRIVNRPKRIFSSRRMALFSLQERQKSAFQVQVKMMQDMRQ